MRESIEQRIYQCSRCGYLPAALSVASFAFIRA
jgi:hypothetical protein